MDWGRLRDYFIVEVGNTPIYAEHLVRRLIQAVDESGLNLRRFRSGPGAAKDEGTRVLALVRRRAGVNSYNHLQKALNLVAKKAGFDTLHFKRMPEPQMRPHSLAAWELQRLVAYRSKRPGWRGDEETGRRRALFWWSIYTASRRGEAFRARASPSHMDPRANTFTIPTPSKQGIGATLTVEREFYSPKRPLMAWLRVRPIVAGSRDIIWTSSLGGRPRAMSYAQLGKELAEMGREVGVRVSYNRTRHTRATMLLRAGMNLRFIKDYLRHAKLETTARYAESSPEDLAAALKRFRPPSLIRSGPSRPPETGGRVTCR